MPFVYAKRMPCAALGVRHFVEPATADELIYKKQGGLYKNCRCTLMHAHTDACPFQASLRTLRSLYRCGDATYWVTYVRQILSPVSETSATHGAGEGKW
jgi:hypothetical protein